MESENNKINVLYVDDEKNNLVAFKANFRREFEVFTAENADEGIDLLKKHKFHIIISDQKMPQMTGVEFFGSIIKEFPEPIRILTTGYSDIEAVIDAINIGKVFNYITKPWNDREMIAYIRQAYKLYKLKEEKKELINRLLRANKQLEFMLRQKLLS